MRSVRKLLFITAALIATSSFAQTALTLQQCIELAAKNNLQLLESKGGVDYSKKASEESKLLLLPNLNGGASYFWNFGYTVDPVTNFPIKNNFSANSYQLTSSLSLYKGGTNTNTIKKSQVDLQMANMEYQSEVDNIQFQVITAYLNVLFAKEQLNITQNKIATSQIQLDNSEKLAQAGSIPEGNLLTLQAQLASDQLSVIQAQNELDKSYLDLKLLLQLKPDDKIDVVVPDINQLDKIINEPVPDADSVADYAIEHKSTIKKFDFQEMSNQLSEKIASSSSLPSLSLFGQLSTEYSNASIFGIEPDPYTKQLNNNLSEVVGLQLQIPLFNNGLNMLNRQSAELTTMDTQLNKQIAVNQMRQDVASAINDLKAALASYDAAKTNYDAAEKAFEFTSQKFNLGTASSFDYTNAINTKAQAESTLVQAKYDLIFKSKIIDYYLDKPLDF